MISASQMPGRDKLLGIIDGTDSPDVKEARIKSLDKGKPYRYILTHFIASGRRVDVRIDYVPNRMEEKPMPPSLLEVLLPPAQTRTIPPSSLPGLNPAIATGEYGRSRGKTLYYPRIAVKTNTLLWLGIAPELKGASYFIPNGGIEYYFAHRWSVNAEAAYTYQNIDDGM